MFKKYQIYKFGSWYGISKRHLLFFRCKLHYRSIILNPLNGETFSILSNTRLLFETAKESLTEIGHIHHGGEIVSRKFKDNKLFSVQRAQQ